MNVLTLWDGRHFFGDNCPGNGCSMYHLHTSMMMLMLVIIAGVIVLNTFGVIYNTRSLIGSSWIQSDVMMTMEMVEVEIF